MTNEHQQPGEFGAMFDHLSFAEMFRQRAEDWIEFYDDANQPRINDLVTLTYRNRGDYFGYFLGRQRTSRWRPIISQGLVSFPVIERSIMSKKSTAMSTNIQVQIEAVRDIPEKQAGAELARNTAKFLKTRLWTKKMDAELEELRLLGRFAFIHCHFNPNNGITVKTPTKEIKPSKSGTTRYNCMDCGMIFGPEELGIDDVADAFVEQDLVASTADNEDLKPILDKQGINPEEMRMLGAGGEDGDPNTHKCPNCGTEAVVLDKRAKWELITALTGGYQESKTGDIEMQVISPLLIRCDTNNNQGFNYRNCDWFNYHPLIPVYELLAIAPELEDKIRHGDYEGWSEGARWHYELNNNQDGYSYRGRQVFLDDLVEINLWWVTPNASHGWRAPMDETIGGFTFKEGESIEEAHIRQDPNGEFRGCAVMMFDDQVVAIGNEHFLEKWVGVANRVDAQSFFPQGEENLIYLQDAATNVMNMAYQFTKKATMPKLVVDMMRGFNKDHVSENRPGQVIIKDHGQKDPDGVRTHVLDGIGYLQPADLPATVYQIITLIIDIAKETSGVFNETVGNVSDQETLGGRQMALNQSMGLQTPTIQAKSDAIRDIFRLWMSMIQRHAPNSFFDMIKGTFDEEWKAQDIQAFREMDVQHELQYTIVEGTDIPRTQLEMEHRFMTAVSMNLFVEPNPLPIDVRNHIIKSVLGIDYDLANYSSYKRLAERRFETLKEELETINPNEAITIVPDMNGFPQRGLHPEIVAALGQHPHIQARATDEHLTFIEFYTDKLNGLLGAREQNEVLIFALEALLDMHRAMLSATMVQSNSAQGLADSVPDNMNQAVQTAMTPAPEENAPAVA